ncbi:MAG: alkaline phosphatase family protein [Bdellovibrionota bacterium]
MAHSPYKRCIFFLADGARADVLRRLSAAGELPEISKYLTEPGTLAEATSVFPSTTGPAYLPFLTGRYPGPCNMPGIRWFDRKAYATDSPFTLNRTRSYCGLSSLLINSDLSPDIPTVFDFAKKPFNHYNPITRGISKDRNRYRAGLAHVMAHYTADHSWTHQKIMDGLVRTVAEDFDFIFVVLPGPDLQGHYNQPESKQALAAYREVDEAVGRVGDLLSRIGWLEDTLLFLSADHGMTATHTHFDLDGFLDRKGFRAYYHPNVFRYWTSANAASMVSGNSMSHLYFKNGKGWMERTPFEELNGGSIGNVVDDLLSYESIDLVFGPSADGAVRVKSRRGQARIERKADGQFAYRVERGGDPFGYGPLPAVMGEREALAQTFGSQYPDAIVQALQIFDSPRAGDLIICASDGHDLRMHNEHPEHRASHGALTRHQMLVPFLTNHPLEAAEPIRTVDFFPTAFGLLGWDMPAVLDGIDLVEAARKKKAA